MALTLSQLCVNAEKTYQLKLIAGEDGMDNVVRWVHIIEDVEVSHFIEGQELVFTTGIAQHGVNWLMPYAEQLLRHGAVGLVINLGPYIEKVPPQLIVWCNTHVFPLLVLPWLVHIIDVTYDFCHRIIQSEKHERSIASAFSTWIFAPEKGESYTGILQRAGFQENGRYQVMLLHLQGKEHELTDLEWEQLQFRVYRALRKTHLSICIFRLEQSICLVGQNTREKLRQYVEQVSQILSERGNVYCGISEEQIGYTALSALYLQAKAADAVCRIRKKQVLCYSDLGVYQILFGVKDRKILEQFSESVLGALVQYDARNHTDYLEVLYRYLSTECSVQQTADQMQVHRNTINYKLRQIREILQTDLGQEARVQIYLAYLIRDML